MKGNEPKMAIPVLIPARNESAHLGWTLDSLACQEYETEPIVIINECTDNGATAEIALSRQDVTTLESVPGKMRALQAGLRYLGDRALEPLLILDADTRPPSKRWSHVMSDALKTLGQDAPAVVWGPYAFVNEINPLIGAVITAASAKVSWSDRNLKEPRTIRGGNTGLRLHDEQTLQAILDMENYYPREDVAIFDTVMEHGGNKKVLFELPAWTFTSGFRTADMIRRIVKDHRHPSRVMDESYASDAPENSQPYFSATTATVVHDVPPDEA
jgi:glycosyltransferase involved in cell wall biosynthesis